ncbi:MAG: FmdB family transcriptional regulator [Chloroflexi bacterium]|nr:FmdB family transcriptional regulator [Chloroflexota bacterium]MYD47980.1 FmdB family transcriptional regulator [Chloroflexota bacterium]
MPRYDYKCTVCANEFELVQKFSEAGQGECPICGGAGQRVFHAVPVIYKGSGFYTTDYGRPKRPAESSESRESSSESASTNGSSSSGDDAKPAEAAPASTGESSGSAAPAAAGSNST